MESQVRDSLLSYWTPTWPRRNSFDVVRRRKMEIIHSTFLYIITFSWCRVSSVHLIPSVWWNLSRCEQMIYNWDHLYIYTFWLRLLGHDSPRSRSLGLKSKSFLLFATQQLLTGPESKSLMTCDRHRRLPPDSAASDIKPYLGHFVWRPLTRKKVFFLRMMLRKRSKVCIL